MKFVSTIALGMALALGAGAVIGVQPAVAKEKPAKQKSFNLSKPVREAVAAAQAALTAKDTATATAKLNEAKAAATSPDDKYVVSSVMYDLGRQTNNMPMQQESIEAMLASGLVPPEQQASFNTAAGQMAFQAKQYPKAITYLDAAVKAGATDPNIQALLVEAKNSSGKPADAVETLEAAIAKQQAAGQPVPTEWYGRGLGIALGAKGVAPADQARLNASAGRLGQGLVSSNPSKSNWRDALLIYRDSNKVDPDQELDILRLLRVAGALKGERDYLDYVQATYLKFPGEAKAVLEDGSKAGFVSLTSGFGKEYYDLVKNKIAGDKASLGKTAGTGRAALATADAWMGYADYATAIELYKSALAKGGVDANIVNTRMGQALALSGQKDAAKTTFGTITGPRAGLARYWTIYLDKGSI